MKNYTATEALELLCDFRDRKKSFSAFFNYDDSMKQMRQRYHQKMESISDPLKAVAKELVEIADQSFFLLQVVEWKIDYLAEALLYAIRSKNPLSLANNARALVEHIASISNLGAELSHLEESLKGQQSEKVIMKALKRTKSYLKKAYYGKSPKLAEKTEEKSIHVNDSLKILSKEVQNVEEIYDFL